MVQAPHRGGVDPVREAVQGIPELGVAPQGLRADQRDRLVGREEAAVVDQHDEVERGDPAVGRVARRHVDRPPGDRLVQQVSVHLDRRLGEVEAVSPRQAGEAVGASAKLGAEADPEFAEVPARSEILVIPSRSAWLASHQQRESILEAERRQASIPCLSIAAATVARTCAGS